jgi:hypothetical protein
MNLYEDLNFPKTESFPNYPNIHVHSGFLYAYLGLKNDMINVLKKAMSISNTSLIIGTGHSLGAAIAT